MSVDADNGLEYRAGGFEGETLWRVGAALLGASLWAQLFWYPLATEFLSGAAGVVYVAVYALPLLALFVALIVDEPPGYLFFVPGSFLPGLVLLPGHDVGTLLQLHRSVAAVGTLLCYLFSASLTVRTRGSEVEEIEELDRDELDHVEGLYRHYTNVRIGILSVLFVVLVGAGIFDPTITGAIAEHHGAGRIPAQVFLVVLGFFIWCVLAYTMFFLPAANIEYDIRRLSREIDGMAEDASAIRWRLGLTVAGGLAVLAFASVFWLLW